MLKLCAASLTLALFVACTAPPKPVENCINDSGLKFCIKDDEVTGVLRSEKELSELRFRSPHDVLLFERGYIEEDGQTHIYSFTFTDEMVEAITDECEFSLLYQLDGEEQELSVLFDANECNSLNKGQ